MKISLGSTSVHAFAICEPSRIDAEGSRKKGRNHGLPICRLEDVGYEGHSLSMMKPIAAALDKRVEIRLFPSASSHWPGGHKTAKPAHAIMPPSSPSFRPSLLLAATHPRRCRINFLR